jgi:hypothetical protein
MSLDIHQFIDEIVINEIPRLAMVNPYYGAGLIAGAIEFLGACLDNHPIAVKRKSAERFCYAVNELFPPSYRPFSRQPPYTEKVQPPHDLYSCLRCGMAHVLRPQGVCLTATLEEARIDGNSHLTILNRSGKTMPLIIVEQFKIDFIAAAEELNRRLKAVPLPTKLQGDFLTVWPS